jgi:hypothetical protein
MAMIDFMTVVERCGARKIQNIFQLSRYRLQEICFLREVPETVGVPDRGSFFRYEWEISIRQQEN